MAVSAAGRASEVLANVSILYSAIWLFARDALGAMERGEGVGIHVTTVLDSFELGLEDVGGAFAVFDAVANRGDGGSQSGG
jgi:hypothetical protein